MEKWVWLSVPVYHWLMFVIAVIIGGIVIAMWVHLTRKLNKMEATCEAYYFLEARARGPGSDSPDSKEGQ